tara:strand:+ start:20 stop:424 length:405 start_codon:yes stop_codon:yes gene_type:complete
MSDDSNKKELEITPGVVTTSNFSYNESSETLHNSILQVTHDEAFKFAEEYHKGWKDIEQYWNNIAALGGGAIVIGTILLFVGTTDLLGSSSLILAGILGIIGGSGIIIYALEKLKFVRTGKEYMLKANIRIRSK